MKPRTECVNCGRPQFHWSEHTTLKTAPDYWPDTVPYDPPPIDVHITLCLWCGRRTEHFPGVTQT